MSMEEVAAKLALVQMARRYERLRRALSAMVETCGIHIEDVLAEEDAPDMFAAIDEARAALEEEP